MYKEFVLTCSVSELELVLREDSFNAFFTKGELEQAKTKNSIKSLGARYLIKEKLKELLNDEFSFLDVEIINDKTGKPIISYKSNFDKKLKASGINKIEISISHSKNQVASLLIIE